MATDVDEANSTIDDQAPPESKVLPRNSRAWPEDSNCSMICATCGATPMECRFRVLPSVPPQCYGHHKLRAGDTRYVLGSSSETPVWSTDLARLWPPIFEDVGPTQEPVLHLSVFADGEIGQVGSQVEGVGRGLGNAPLRDDDADEVMWCDVERRVEAPDPGRGGPHSGPAEHFVLVPFLNDDVLAPRDSQVDSRRRCGNHEGDSRSLTGERQTY